MDSDTELPSDSTMSTCGVAFAGRHPDFISSSTFAGDFPSSLYKSRRRATWPSCLSLFAPFQRWTATYTTEYRHHVRIIGISRFNTAY